MALAVATCTLVLRNTDGTALSGADVHYRVEPQCGDASGDGNAESAIYAKRATVQTSGTGVATMVVPSPSTLYLSVPRASIPECALAVPSGISTLDLGPLIEAQLPDLPW